MAERKVVAECCVCGGLIYEGEAYRKVGLFKPNYAHEVCLQIKKAKAMALYAALSNIYRS